MYASTVISLDVMGGDNAPSMVIEGADIACQRHSDVGFLLFGDEAEVGPLLKERPRLGAVSELRHTPDRVTGEDKPSQALRRGRNTSMRLAIDAVRDGEASGIVSAGNTGALMAMAKVVLQTLPGIDRPALASFLPTLRGECVMLDLGANTEGDVDNLIQFALMGAEFYRAIKGVASPTVGLLNVGVEELKGNEMVKAAGRTLRDNDMPFEFVGFIEGNDITKGTANVVVTDGFTGNIALKTVEGAARMFTKFLSLAYRKSLLSKIGFLLARSSLRELQETLDPSTYNGAVFLGVNGIAVKSHGNSEPAGFANAVSLAVSLAREGLVEHIVDDFNQFSSTMNPDAEAAAS